ncbi:MAG: hypothetical protein AAF680_00260 [Pseudomonadota bacterium]
MAIASPNTVERVIGIAIALGGLQSWRFAFGFVGLPSFPVTAALLHGLKVTAYLVLMAGAIGLVLRLRPRYWLTYLGTLLSFGGVVWSYVPYLPMAFGDTSSAMYALLVGNTLVIAALVVLQRRSRPSAKVEHAA